MYSPGWNTAGPSSFFYEKGASTLVNWGLKTVLDWGMYDEHEKHVMRIRHGVTVKGGSNIHKPDGQDAHLTQPNVRWAQVEALKQQILTHKTAKQAFIEASRWRRVLTNVYKHGVLGVNSDKTEPEKLPFHKT